MAASRRSNPGKSTTTKPAAATKKASAAPKTARPAGDTQTVRVDLATLRAFQAARQSLGGSAASNIADVVRATGWLTTAGGQGPYLALRARSARFRREDLDRHVIAAPDLVHLPAARGCTMLVPADEAPYALALARRAFVTRMETVKKKTDVTDKEIADLCDAVAIALARRGTLAPDAIRYAVSAGPMGIRSLGEAGKKIGESTTLPLAIRRLELQGFVRRVHQRLDANHFEYALFAKDAPARRVVELAPAEAHRDIARRFFRWLGPVAHSVFAWWAGITQAEARAAIQSLDLTRVEVTEGTTEELWALPEDAESLANHHHKEDGRYSFLPMRDNYVSLRHDLAQLAAPAHHAALRLDAAKVTAGYAMGWMEHHTIVRNGQLIGLWEWDPESKEIVAHPFDKPGAAEKKALTAGANSLADFIRTQLAGDARITAIDHLPSQKARADELRAMGR